jgi:perosamine synthetase
MLPQYEPLTGIYEQTALNEYLKNPGFWTEYKKTTEFEQKIAEYLKIKHCIVVNNGTISLSLALLAMGIKPGDNVIVPDLTMIATPNAVRFIGANPIFVDITPDGLLDLYEADKAIKIYNAKALIFVSLNGRSFNNTAWEYLWKWKENGIRLLEDAAQSFGSKNYEGYFCGTRGFEIGSFSFSMPKIITSGQGGCLVTDNDELATTLRHLKDFGRASGGNDKHDFFGINCKFTEMQAVLGLAQLNDIQYRVLRKKQMHKIYEEE